MMKKGISLLLGMFPFFTMLDLSSAYAVVIPPLPPAAMRLTPPSVDSGQVRPPSGVSSSTSIATQYPDLVVPSQPVSNEAYSSLPACPSNPVCPDINGKMPDGSSPTSAPATCPDYCTVQRQVQEQTVGQVTSVISTVAATCPSSYAVVGTYQVGKEIIQNNNPPPAPYPISDMTTFNQYINNGYSCALVSSGTYTQCGSSFNGTPFGNPASPFTSAPSPAPGIIYGGYVGYYIAISANSNYCKYSTTPCSQYCDSSQEATDTLSVVPYVYIRCTPKPGLFYSGNMVPTALVCAVRKPTWKTLN